MTTLEMLHQQGRLSQTCPSCGLVEAAGSYCTKCLTKTGESDWSADPRHVTRGLGKALQRPETPISAVGVQP